jgi:DNA primase
MNNNKNSGSNEWERKVKKARSIPIQAMCERLGIELTKKGESGWYGSCPICDDEGTNLHVSPEKGNSGLWYCFECSEGGDPLALYMEVREKSFPESVKALIN